MNRRTFITTSALALTAGCTTTKSTADGTVTEVPSTSPRPTETSSDGIAHRTIGETHVCADSVSVTVESARLAETAQFQNDTTVNPSPENALVLAFVKASNQGSTIATLPAIDAFTLVADGSQYEPLYTPENETKKTNLTFPVSGDLYHGILFAHPDVTTAGWMIFEVPRDTTDVRFSLAEVYSVDPTVYWDGTVDPSARPQMEIQSLDVPAKHVNGKPVQFSVTVTNTGESPGVYNQTFNVARSDGRKTTQGSLSGRIDPGETHTFTKTIQVPSVQNLTVSMSPKVEQTIDVVPATRTFGTPYETTTGVVVQVDTPIITDSVTIDRGSDTWRDRPVDGQFATVIVTTWNPTRKKKPELDEDYFETEVNGFIALNSNRGFSSGLVKPVKAQYYVGTGMTPGERERGALYFDAPNNTNTKDVICRIKIPIDQHANEICEWKM